jgi:hypothetical protein
MHVRAACLLAALALAGCSQTWNPNGKSDAQFKQDQEACRQQAEASGNMVNVAGTPMRDANSKAYNSCMESKGYTLR